MKKTVSLFFVFILFVIGLPYYLIKNKRIETSGTPTPTEQLDNSSTNEQAELTGFNFIQNFINSAPPQSDLKAAKDAYDALSVNAKTKVSPDSISRDLAALVGVQDVPDGGFSVEDLQFEGLEKAKYIIGLNFSGGRVLRSINLIKEEGSWKVDSVDSLEQYP